MRKIMALTLAFVMCVSLAACGGKSDTGAEANDSVNKGKGVSIYVHVPENWADPCCQAVTSDESDAPAVSEKMIPSGDWYTVEMTGEMNSIIIEGNGGAVQTRECEIQPGKDVWVIVDRLGNTHVYYEEPQPLSPEEILAAVENGVELQKISDMKAITVAYNVEDGEELDKTVYVDYLPEEPAAKYPEEISYIVNLRYTAITNHSYMVMMGYGSVYNCTVIAEIVDVTTGEVVQETSFAGKGLPAHITTTEEKYYEEYVEDEVVLEWVQEALNTSREQKYADALEKAKSFLGNGYSYAEIEQVVLEYDECTLILARYAADNCGADWNQEAVIAAKWWLEYGDGYTPQTLVENLQEISGFTEEQAIYGMENSGADWNIEALKTAEHFVEIGLGYSQSAMLLVLTNDYGFTESQAKYAVDHCDADWDQVALDYVMLNLEYAERSYTREEMIQEMVEFGGFTKEQAVYACDEAGLK